MPAATSSPHLPSSKSTTSAMHKTPLSTLDFSASIETCIFATITDAALRWQVDRATARAAIVAAKIEPSNFHATPRYAWHDLLTFVEGWDDLAVMSIDTTARLYRAEEIADRFNLTSQTIRNYGRSGRLHEIRLSIRTLRYAQNIIPVQQSEANSVEHGKL